MFRCPNCNSPVDSDPVHCDVCGYRPDLAREFFWLYLGGATIVFVGLATGSLGVALEGTGPEHWSRSLRGWFPLAPWPADHHWLAFVVVGILLTIGGLGITRRRPLAWFGLAALVVYQFAWILLAGAGRAGPAFVAVPIGGGVLLALLLLRVGLAFRRTPKRDAYQMQLRARAKQDTGDR